MFSAYSHLIHLFSNSCSKESGIIVEVVMDILSEPEKWGVCCETVYSRNVGNYIHEVLTACSPKCDLNTDYTRRYIAILTGQRKSQEVPTWAKKKKKKNL